MTSSIRRTLSMIGLALLPSLAEGSIGFAAADWKAPGDQLLTRYTDSSGFASDLRGTLYDITHLEWLDVSLTVGKSFNEVEALTAAGQPFASFRHPTAYEIIGLFRGALGYDDPQVTSVDYPVNLFEFVALTAIPINRGAAASPLAGAYYDRSPSDPLTAVGLLIYDPPGGALRTSYTNNAAFGRDDVWEGIGSLLVREQVNVVAEPTEFSLLLSGMLALAYVGRRRVIP